MKLAKYYSHLNGWEYLQVHKPRLWQEIKEVIESVDASQCRTKVSKEKTRRGEQLYSPIALNPKFREGFRARGWQESRVSYWVTDDEKLIRKTMHWNAEEQEAAIKIARFRRSDPPRAERSGGCVFTARRPSSAGYWPW